MTALRPDFPQILTLAEQLDAMLLGWLERNGQPTNPTATATAILTVVADHIAEVETFCARWNMRVDRLGGGTKWASIRVEGPRLPVIGFAEITTLFRR
ncbi:MAG TPA: hypothetical protein VI300_06755 [Solirubrobacter sp.]